MESLYAETRHCFTYHYIKNITFGSNTLSTKYKDLY